jgi:signal transduction histidine kinase
MKVNHIITLLFLSFLFHVNPTISNNLKVDTTQISQWIKQSKELVYSQPDIALFYADSILKKSEKIDYRQGFYTANNLIGIANYMKGNYKESIYYYSEALKYANSEKPQEEIKTLTNISYSLRNLHFIDSALIINEKVVELARKNNLTDTYNKAILDVAYAYMEQEDFVKSAIFYHQVIEDIKNSTDTNFLIQSYSSLAMFYYKIEDFNTSRLYYKKAINLNIKYPELNFLSVNYANLGILFQHLKNDYDSAIYYFRTSLNYIEDFEYDIKKLKVDINIGNCFLDQDIYDSAYAYYKIALKSPALNKDPLFQAAVYTNIGTYYLRKNQLTDAEHYLLKGLHISNEIEHLEFQQIAYNYLFQLDSLQKKYSKAIYYYQKYHHFSNLRKKEEVSHQMAKLDYEKHLAEKKYNNDLLLKENQNQNQKIIIQKTIIGIVIIVVLVLIIITIIVSKNRKKVNQLNTHLEATNKNLEELNAELTKQKQEMKELLMSKDRFVSILGHDLKNPFTGLIGLLELIQEDWDEIPDTEKKESIQSLFHSSVQTYQLLEDLLDWGKTQQGLINVTKTKFEIAVLIREVKNIFHLQLKDKKMELECYFSTDLEVYTDIKLLSQILQNFVGNAIKFSYPESTIDIKVEDDDQETKICIIDHGIGIPEDKIDALFDLDKYFNRPGTNNEKSTGMGLILCKEYAKILDAEITVNSKENEGSSFCLILPKQ